MDIYILSSGRPHKQTTLESLPPSLRKRAILVVPIAEAETYSRTVACHTISAVAARGIGPTRQWCIEESEDKMVMLDDDLVFATRRIDNPTKFKPSTPEEVEALFKAIENQLANYVHVGVGTREGGNRNTARVYHVNRMLRILAYRAEVLRRHEIKFDRIPVMEDFDVTLQLLRKNMPNAIINWIVHNQNGSNLAGGCSQYRTSAMQTEAALKLAYMHTPYVSVVKKQTKTAWGGKERTDVRIQWKQAYEGR